MKKFTIPLIFIMLSLVGSVFLAFIFSKEAEPVFNNSEIEENIGQHTQNAKQEFLANEAILVPKILSANITFVGDLMVHTPQLEFAKEGNIYNFDKSFQFVKPYIEKADFAVGNMETVLGGEEIGYTDFPTFNAPDSFGQAIKNTGFDLVTTANNHCMDKGLKGLLKTIETLDKIALSHIGTYETKEKAENIFIKEINGINFAFLSYTYGTNGINVPNDFSVNLLDHRKIENDISKAKDLGADIVLILPHMGIEYEQVPRESVKQSVLEMLNFGASGVIISHPHVASSMEFIDITDKYGVQRKCFVAYSLGNFISSQRTLPREEGVILNLEFEKNGEKEAIIKNFSKEKTWVKFKGEKGNVDISILPVAEFLSKLQNGINIDLRQKDIQRIKNISAE